LQRSIDTAWLLQSSPVNLNQSLSRRIFGTIFSSTANCARADRVLRERKNGAENFRAVKSIKMKVSLSLW
jgi:hypothetical protein